MRKVDSQLPSDWFERAEKDPVSCETSRQQPAGGFFVRDGRNNSARWSQPVCELIADAINCENIARPGGVGFDFAAQILDMGVYAAIVARGSDSVQPVE